MDRRSFLKTAVAGSIIATFTETVASAERYFPVKVNQSLFDGINRVKDPSMETGLEKSHAPVITAPPAVKAGQPFIVEVSVGENLHPMGPYHWIEYIELSLGNEPAGRVDFQSTGYLKPKVTFTMMIPKEAAPDGKVTLVARQQCNLHGLWEGNFDVTVS